MEHLSILQPTTKLTLGEVRNRFESWRKGKKRGSRIPKRLWSAAVEVCAVHSVNQVSRALGLNHTALKRRVGDTEGSADRQSGSGRDFVELSLGLGAQPVLCGVELESAAGGKLKMTFAGKCRDFDPLELARAFWGWGR